MNNSESNLNMENKANQLRDILYTIAKRDTPEYVFQWFFRYFAKGPDIFKDEPKDILENYHALFQTAMIMLEHKYSTKKYSPFIKDYETPDWTYYFVGDTHGSFEDTYIIIDYLIRAFQANKKIKVVFLGDYIDRNAYDLQNLAFIVSFWIIFPENVFILRGNHEDSSVCNRYGFSQHLFEKAGNKELFEPIWQNIIEFFSKLPLGIKIRSGNKNIFAIHGGFPFNVDNYTSIKLTEIESKLNCFQEEHFQMDALSQTILWADPDPENLIEGVAPSPRTGRPRFSRKAFEEFLKINELDMMIRGHQKFSKGYQLLWNNRLISLFSTSKYDGRNIGHAKILRLKMNSHIEDIGDEQLGLGKGILEVDPEFLEKQIEKHYKAKIKR